MREAQFARACLEVARDIYGELTNEVRERVSATLKEHYLRMSWKREGIDSVTIDDKYRVSVRNHRGWEILDALSAGERECLALAFSLALSEISGFELADGDRHADGPPESGRAGIHGSGPGRKHAGWRARSSARSCS